MYVLTTCTISLFFLFSSALFKFSILRCFLPSFSACFSALTALDISLTRFKSSLNFCFLANDNRIPRVLTMEENLQMNICRVNILQI